MTVRLDLLGTRIDVACPDASLRSLVEKLWSPFVIEDGAGAATLVSIERGPADDWVLTDGAGAPTHHREVWNLMDATRHLVLRAVKVALPGFVPLHAACVARRGVALLLPGASGAGKTTLTLALLERGWSYLTDDLAPVEIEGGLVRPFPKPLGVKDRGSWERIAGRCTLLRDVPAPEATFLVPAECFDVAGAPVRAGHVVFPSYDPAAPPSLSALSAAEAVAVTSSFVPHLDESVIASLTRLCGGWSSHRMSYDTTARALETIEEIVGI